MAALPDDCGALFFARGGALIPPWTKSLERIIRQALEEGRTKGQDYLTQTQLAVGAGQRVRPDLTASEILAAVRRLQQS